jgi:hypothetical protein
VTARTASRLAWGSSAATISLLGFAIVFGALTASPGAADAGGTSSLVASVVFVFAFATVGALVASRRPANPIGWIMCASGLAYAIGGVSVVYVESFDPGSADLGFLATLALWVSSWVWMAGIAPIVTFVLLLFPSGRLLSSRWKPVAVAAGAGTALVVVGIALNPGRFEDYAIENPVGVPGAEAAAAVGALVLIGAALASVASVVFRYRHGRHDERQQLKWLTFAAGLVGLTAIALTVAEAAVSRDITELSNTVVSASLATVPVAIGVAILRYGLYDVDLVINRTLVYGALTATLAAAYLGSVLLLQLALSPLTEQSDLAIAGSTLAVAALFRPARRRIQELVDRRFFRSRYDAALTLAGFGTRLRDEVELDAVSGELRAVVAQTMQPAHVSLWLREAPR